MDPTERFTELVNRPEPDIPLDEAALLIAAHAHPDLDLAAPLRRLDALASEFTGGDADDLARYLFVEQGFAGNTVDYGDPRNSYLDDVLARRLGIPITLSLVMMEVGRRAGVAVLGVGMPGHFLVRPADESGAWFDPFHEGRRLDEKACRELYSQLHGEERRPAPGDLDPVTTTSIVSRVLANLQRSLLGRDPSSARWVLRLRLRMPDLSDAERASVAALLGNLGSFLDAADALAETSARLSGEDAAQLERQAAALRARAN